MQVDTLTSTKAKFTDGPLQMGKILKIPMRNVYAFSSQLYSLYKLHHPFFSEFLPQLTDKEEHTEKYESR